MDTNTIRDLTQRSLSSSLIRLSRYVIVGSLNLIRLSRSIIPVHEIYPDRSTDFGRLNTNVIRLSRSILSRSVNEIDDERVRDLGRVLNLYFINPSRSIMPVNEIDDEILTINELLECDGDGNDSNDYTVEDSRNVYNYFRRLRRRSNTIIF